MPGTSDPYAAFRLNLEQQRKRAKDLLRAVRAGDAAARRRLADAVALPVPDAVTIKLADAQFAIARELGFRTWRDLRTHVMAQAAAREAITQPGPPLAATCRRYTLAADRTSKASPRRRGSAVTSSPCGTRSPSGP